MITPRKSVASAEAYKAPLEGRGDYIRLDFNENTAALGTENQYPEYADLVQKIADLNDIPTEHVLLTNGSSEALFLTAFSFIEPGVDLALTSLPTFGLIPHYLSLCDADVIEVPATKTLEFDVDVIESKLSQGVKLAMFASPDNPTGAVLSSETIFKWTKAFPETLFVIDEAYGEFNPDRFALSQAIDIENLLIIRTFSKAMGMAGSRLGFIVGNEKLLNVLARVRAPYSVNSHAVEAGLEVLRKPVELRRTVEQILSTKKEIISCLEESGFVIHSGKANFFMMCLGADAENFCRFVRENGVLVRDRSHMPMLDGTVRVSIGTPAEMETFRELIVQFRKKSALIFDLDDTLVDASISYPEAVKKAVVHFGGEPPTDSEYWQLKAEGGFNDDWVAAHELLARQSIKVSLDSVIDVGKSIYLRSAKSLEKLIFSARNLQELRRRYRLFIFTGRYRDEFEPIWGDTLTTEFENVYCVDDFDGLPPKPAPDMLRKILQENELCNAWYVGNSVDDIRAAKAASVGSIALTTTLSRQEIKAEGAHVVIDSLDQLPGVFGL